MSRWGLERGGGGGGGGGVVLWVVVVVVLVVVVVVVFVVHMIMVATFDGFYLYMYVVTYACRRK